MADNLREVLEIARREMPDVPAEFWARFEGLVRFNFGATRLYIAAQRKRAHLEILAEIGDQQSANELAAKMGITPRRIRQLKTLG